MTTPSIVFYNRDYTGKIALPVMPVVERYSHHMLGGPEKAYLAAPPHADMWDLLKLLRCPVEIYGGDGRLNWWGYVNRIGIPHGEQRIGLGLDSLYNHVTHYYSTNNTATTAASNAVSIAEYGQKEMKIFDTSATQAQGEQVRDMYIAEHQYARPETEFTGGNDSIKIECYGWYNSLGWKYYTSTDASNVENTTQITSMVTSAGQFLRGTLVEHIAGITSTAERDGRRPALDYINDLLDAGTTDVRPLLATVDKDRYLHVYERTAEPVATADYMLTKDGGLVSPLNQVEPPERCIAAKWVQVQDVPISALSTVAMRPFFIESAEYTAATDRTIYRPAGAYEQTRLAKYIAKVINDDEEHEYYPPVDYGTGGGGGITTWSMKAFYQGTEVYSTINGITLNDTSTATFYEIQFTTPSAGLYHIGASINHTEGGVTAVYAALVIYGIADYVDQSLTFGDMSETLTTPIYTSLSVVDYLPANQLVRITGTLSNNTKADQFFFFVAKLS